MRRTLPDVLGRLRRTRGDAKDYGMIDRKQSDENPSVSAPVVGGSARSRKKEKRMPRGRIELPSKDYPSHAWSY